MRPLLHLAVAASMLLASSRALACSCRLPPLDELIGNSDVVIRATFVSVAGAEVRVEVHEVYVGPRSMRPGRTIRARWTTFCGGEIDDRLVGIQGVLFFTRDCGELVLSYCSLMSSMSVGLLERGPLREPIPVELRRARDERARALSR